MPDELSGEQAICLGGWLVRRMDVADTSAGECGHDLVAIDCCFMHLGQASNQRRTLHLCFSCTTYVGFSQLCLSVVQDKYCPGTSAILYHRSNRTFCTCHIFTAF